MVVSLFPVWDLENYKQSSCMLAAWEICFNQSELQPWSVWSLHRQCMEFLQPLIRHCFHRETTGAPHVAVCTQIVLLVRLFNSLCFNTWTFLYLLQLYTILLEKCSTYFTIASKQLISRTRHGRGWCAFVPPFVRWYTWEFYVALVSCFQHWWKSFNLPERGLVSCDTSVNIKTIFIHQ